ncbi:hypothetical protein BCD48_35365 [Pseudofrankia sp. BMG5.36]|nr:hypothetical protein BCD48_35365 [Pseudofrankia sp. BMG5.36]
MPPDKPDVIFGRYRVSSAVSRSCWAVRLSSFGSRVSAASRTRAWICRSAAMVAASTARVRGEGIEGSSLSSAGPGGCQPRRPVARLDIL